MTHLDSFSTTPGKILTDIGFSSYTVEADKVNYEIHYEEAPVLSNGFIVKFETNGETIYGYVINNWFEGAYNLPSFTCMYIYNETTKTYQAAEKTFRFKNVEIKEIQTSDDTIEDIVINYNDLIKEHGRYYYPGIHRVENLEERLKEYWYTYFDEDSNTFLYDKTQDKNFKEDDHRYFVTHNYYRTNTEACQKAKELNNMLKK